MYKIIAKGNKEVDVKFYGEIYQYSPRDAKNFSLKLEELAKKYDVIHLHVHSPGGDVFEGFAIYNAIINSEATVYTYVDGVAASMASVIILAGAKVYMASNSFLMIHQPYFGGGGGNAKELRQKADLLEKVTKTLSEHYTAKNPELAKKIKEWMAEGDNWLTAKEALKYGLIDGITEAKSKKDIPDNYENLTVQSAYDYFITDLQIDSSNKIPTKMNDEFKLKIVALGLTGATINSSEAEFQNAIEKVLKENADFKIQIADLNKKADELKKTEMQALLEKAKAKMTKPQFEALSKMAETSAIDAIRNFVDAVPERESIFSQVADNGSVNGKKDWDWYQKNNVEALERMETENPEQFKALYEAYCLDLP